MEVSKWLLEKIKCALDRMNDKYWGKVAEQVSAVFDDAFSKLTVTQYSILEAKYNGYKRLCESFKPSALAKIAKADKERVAALVGERCQIVAELSNVLADLQALIGEMAKLGEH